MFSDMDTAALDTVDMGLMETNDRWQLVFIHILRLVLKFFFFLIIMIHVENSTLDWSYPLPPLY